GDGVTVWDVRWSPRPVGRVYVRRYAESLWEWSVVDVDAHRAYAGRHPTQPEAVAAGLAQRARVQRGAVPRLDPPDPAKHHGGCSNPGCICHDPTNWVVCGEWMAGYGARGRWCVRCGWTRDEHPELVTPTGEAA
ncbi:MAG: hypothetical protein AB7G23_20970, partial [Vicinamibacterales bacterium]